MGAIKVLGWRLCIALLAFCVTTGGHAFAGDYTVSYALDAGDLNDSGTTDACMYALPCVLKSGKLDLSINVSIFLPRRGTQKTIGISAHGGRSRIGCCFFYDGDRYVDINFRDTFLKLGLYEGRARKRNEFVLNSPLGILYLQFSSMK